MSVSAILDELAGMGATLRIAQGQLVLRAGKRPIPGNLIHRIRQRKDDFLPLLREREIIRWLDQHPTPSPPGRCAYCGRAEVPEAVVLPFGTLPGAHVWLHSECWHPWHARRRAEAIGHLTDARVRQIEPTSSK